MARVMASVYASRELQAAVLSMKAVPAEIRRRIARNTREVMNPEWRDLVSRNARTTQERLILARGARIGGTNPPRAIAASSTRRLSGGLVPAESYTSFEAGTRRPNRRATWRRRSPEGTPHDVHGWPERQLPDYRKGGFVVYPAFREIAPRFVSLWVQTIIWTVYDKIEGR